MDATRSATHALPTTGGHLRAAHRGPRRARRSARCRPRCRGSAIGGLVVVAIGRVCSRLPPGVSDQPRSSSPPSQEFPGFCRLACRLRPECRECRLFGGLVRWGHLVRPRASRRWRSLRRRSAPWASPSSPRLRPRAASALRQPSNCRTRSSHRTREPASRSRAVRSPRRTEHHRGVGGHLRRGRPERDATNVSDEAPDQLDVLLVGPQGQQVVLGSDATKAPRECSTRRSRWTTRPPVRARQPHRPRVVPTHRQPPGRGQLAGSRSG